MNEAIHQITFAALFDRIRESSVDMAEITAKLNEKPYRVVDTGIHAKILADWNRKGLLMVKPEANKMHRFSLTEFVWVKFFCQRPLVMVCCVIRIAHASQHELYNGIEIAS